jgi:hypothetical protein
LEALLQKHPNLEEGNMPAKAFANISTNPIHASGMKSNDYWDNVCQKWTELLTMEGSGRAVTPTSVALKLHFQHHNQNDMNQQNACYKCIQSENQSGLNNVVSITKKTKALYKAVTKTPF